MFHPRLMRTGDVWYNPRTSEQLYLILYSGQWAAREAFFALTLPNLRVVPFCWIDSAVGPEWRLIVGDLGGD